MPGDLIFDLGPTQTQFVMSDAHIVQLIGPMGEGKTHAGVAGAIRHAQRNGRDIDAALVRDTFQNIKTSTLKDIQKICGPWAHTSDGGRRVVINSTPKVNLDLFGIDSEADIQKLQGPQYAFIWLEEPAPIYERSNAGLAIGVFRMALARAARQHMDLAPRVQITHNPADDEHWCSLLAEEPYEYMQVEDPQSRQIITVYKDTFHIRKGENKYLSPIARAMNAAAFKDDPAKWARYVEGETATVTLGKKVTPAYKPEIHFSPLILPVYTGEMIQFWDSWLDAACCLAQFNPFGQLVIHDCLSGDGASAPEELLEEQLEPILRTPKYKGKVKGWRIIGDTTMQNPDQSSRKRSAARLLEDRFNCKFEGGPAHWSGIKYAVNQCFKVLLNEGRPKVILSRSATRLHRALKGGWHYKVGPNGAIVGDKPDKNPHSHPGDAFGNGVAVLMPYDPREKYQELTQKAARQQTKLARSYGGGNYSRRGSGMSNITAGFGV